MPLLGFGTWQITGPLATQAVATALTAGYRHVDTATVYGNEREVGAGLRDNGVAREDIFITTKLPPRRAGTELETLRQSLQSLGTDHVDLWLIHWPPHRGVGTDIWQAFVQARDEGLVRDIGVSNYSVDQIDELTAATDAVPAVNQIEWSPLLFDPAVVREHRDRGIVLEGYSALRGGVLTSPTVTAIADRLGRTPAQVVIRWHLQHQVVVIPKSRDPQRIRANGDVAGFQLSPDDMATLDGLGRNS